MLCMYPPRLLYVLQPVLLCPPTGAWVTWKPPLSGDDGLAVEGLTAAMLWSGGLASNHSRVTRVSDILHMKPCSKKVSMILHVLFMLLYVFISARLGSIFCRDREPGREALKKAGTGPGTGKGREVRPGSKF